MSETATALGCAALTFLTTRSTWRGSIFFSTDPFLSSLSVTSNLRWRGTSCSSGLSWKRSYSERRRVLPISRLSRNPSVVMRAVFAPFLVTSAFRPRVVE